MRAEFLLLALLAWTHSPAKESPEAVVCQVNFLEGTLEWSRPTGQEWSFAQAGDTLKGGLRYRTGKESVAEFSLPGGALLCLNENTLVELPASALQAGTLRGEATLMEGEIFFSTGDPALPGQAPRPFRILSRTLSAKITSEAACFLSASQMPSFSVLRGAKGTVAVKTLKPAGEYWIPESKEFQVSLERRPEKPHPLDSLAWERLTWIDAGSPRRLLRERERGRQMRTHLKAVVSDTLR